MVNTFIFFQSSLLLWLKNIQWFEKKSPLYVHRIIKKYLTSQQLAKFWCEIYTVWWNLHCIVKFTLYSVQTMWSIEKHWFKCTFKKRLYWKMLSKTNASCFHHQAMNVSTKSYNKEIFFFFFLKFHYEFKPCCSVHVKYCNDHQYRK